MQLVLLLNFAEPCPKITKYLSALGRELAVADSVRLIGFDEPPPQQRCDGMVLTHSAHIEKSRGRPRTVVNVTSVDVVDFYKTITQLGVDLWIDGGWGVDALLGEQTRPHKDLDIAIQQKDVPV